ncbi:hypothetical protein H206_06317 [Candidatus Electrothrix aarhusensis]|uniref:Uncharacterized protein n=1 Tax=Candidatus Electrothrix aarhusensis TaxID=1859131 RepID=A0A444J3S1_9BACT|nr:hypothetical protein H206_06317 [Candidatus Electrothrix aarhusensis]
MSAVAWSWIRRQMFSTPGFPRPFGPFPPWAGPKKLKS